MSTGILHTRNLAIIQIAIMKEGTSKAKREELAKVNGSYMNPALVGITYDRIFFATLLVIIGIQNSLLKHLTVRLRHHETACLSELYLLTEGQYNLLHHISEVKQWQDFYDKDHKSAKQHRKEYYPLHIPAVNAKTISHTERSELEKKHKGALVRKNAEEKIKKTQDPKEFPAYENIAKAIYSFMKTKRGPEKQTFEEMITTSPILAQQNTCHSGALNGNGIERLLESVEWVFSTLKLLTTTDEKLSKGLSEIDEMWDWFAKMFPLLRSK
jgi:hypothetical protein